MKYTYFFFSLLLLSCGMSKNTFMCGERACVDKKEFNEFFAENLIFEIKNPIDKKKKSLDLVNLNIKIFIRLSLLTALKNIDICQN